MPPTEIALPPLIAHRGLSARAPENTLAAVRAAHDAGCRWVELDVQLLGDGTPVIWHDRSVKRCSDGRGRLAELSWAEARWLDAGRWFAPAFAGEPMASLEAMLALLEERGMGLNLELKVNRGHDPIALAEAAVPAALEALPAERLIVSSFDAAALARSRALAGPDRLALGVLFKRLPGNWATQAKAVSAFSVHADWRYLRAAQAQAIKAAGYALLCYTANNPTAFAPCWRWGVDAAISDDPGVFTSLRR